jgi:hypothetical protein
VLIIAVAGFVSFNMKNLESNQNNIVREKPKQEIQPYHGIVDENEE